MSDFPKPTLTVTDISPAARENMAKALRYIANLVEAGHNHEGGIMVNMPTDTSVHLSADFTVSLIKPGALQ